MIINGIDIDVMAKTKQSMENDPAAALKTNVIEGHWDVKNTRFRAKIPWSKSEFELSADIPPFLGGKGEMLGALQYCLFGSAACYIGTLASVAAEEGIDLGNIHLRIENDVNFRPVLGIAKEPTVKEVRIKVTVERDLDPEVLKRLKEKTDAQCPGMYCLTQPIPVQTEVHAGL